MYSFQLHRWSCERINFTAHFTEFLGDIWKQHVLLDHELQQLFPVYTPEVTVSQSDNNIFTWFNYRNDIKWVTLRKGVSRFILENNNVLFIIRTSLRLQRSCCILFSPISWGFIYHYTLYACMHTWCMLIYPFTYLHCIYLHYWSYTSLWLMLFFVKPTQKRLLYSILFC